MTGYELLWGDALPEVVQRIVGKAVYGGTREHFHDAAEQLSGISSFIIFMNVGQFGTDAILLLNAEQRRMRKMEDDPALRKRVMEIIAP